MENIDKQKKLLCFEGIILIILGVIAILWPNISTIAFELFIGAIFLLSGIVMSIHIIKMKQQVLKGWAYLLSVLFILFGFTLLFFPITGIISLTLLLGILLFLQGCAQIFMGTKTVRFSYGKGQILQGIVALLLSILILSGWPKDAAWVLGLIIGINFFVLGVGILSLLYFNKKS